MYSWNETQMLARQVAQERVDDGLRERIKLAYPTTFLNDVRATMNNIRIAVIGFIEGFDARLDAIVLAQTRTECVLSPVQC